MIAVIFELTPAPGRKQEYLDLAAALKPELERADGFLSIERFGGELGGIASAGFPRGAPLGIHHG